MWKSLPCKSSTSPSATSARVAARGRKMFPECQLLPLASGTMRQLHCSPWGLRTVRMLSWDGFPYLERLRMLVGKWMAATTMLPTLTETIHATNKSTWIIYIISPAAKDLTLMIWKDSGTKANCQLTGNAFPLASVSNDLARFKRSWCRAGPCEAVWRLKW